MQSFSLEYGSGHVTFSLDETRILGVLTGHDVPPVKDIRAHLWEALEHPCQAAPLRETIHPHERVALIVSDTSRFWMRQDLVVPHVIDYLTGVCGTAPGDITIIIANGTHVPGSEQDLRTLVTDAVFDRIRVVNHDCLADDLVTLGTTPHGTVVRIHPDVAHADHVLALGAVTQHVMAGYGGGRKSILPGVSGLDTIQHNHAFALDPLAFRSNPLIGNAVTDGNPLNEDMCEAAGMVRDLFLINLIMNPDMKLCRILAGDRMESWKAACMEMDAMYQVPVPEKADVVIASCGGYPKDMSLYQGTKTIDNVEPCLKKGGTLILLIEARDGGGPAEYFDWIGPLQDGSFEKKLRENFTIPGYIFLLNCEQAQRYRIMMLTSIAGETVAPMGLEAYQDMDTLLRHADLEGKSVYVIPNGSTVNPVVKGEKP